MFVGHYAASLMLKSVEKNSNLGILFLAVQFVDILFFPFVLAGIERIRIVENFTASTHFELVYMPYTHSLVGSIAWAAIAFLIFRFVFAKKGAGKNKYALVVAIAVISHWFFRVMLSGKDPGLRSLA